MNARKAVLADNPELILRVLQLRFDESLSYPRISAQTGISKTDGKYVEIIDRKEAIAYAIHHGQPGDIIVLAGKGHEDYQEIKGKKYPMDERVLIREILEEDAKKKA